MLSYYGHPDNVNAKSQAAGEKISALLVDSALTYEEAEILFPRSGEQQRLGDYRQSHLLLCV